MSEPENPNDDASPEQVTPTLVSDAIPVERAESADTVETGTSEEPTQSEDWGKLPSPSDEAEEPSDEGEISAASTQEVQGVPLIAIVGRPNVGKSRLFNRMTGSRFAIVEDMPGVTRDRQYGEGNWDGRAYAVVDTGGFEPDSDDILLSQMRSQAQLAIDEADIILHLVDAHSGMVPADGEIAQMLRQTRKPVYTVVNKVDGPKHDNLVHEFYALGVSELFPLSAEHGLGYSDLLDDVYTWLPPIPPRAEDDHTIRIAVVGKPNAGKSTLINHLLGYKRLLTSDVPGTTRDSVNTHLVVDGQNYLIIDTAGVRRKRGISENVERYSVVQAFKAMDRADVVIHMFDANEGVTSQDQRIAGLANTKGRGLVLLLNKWDTIKKDHKTAELEIQKLRDNLKFAKNAPVVTTSALTGQRVHRILGEVNNVYAEYTKRVSTGQLNRFLEDATRRNPPKSKGHQRLKIFYASQVATRPPTFMFAVNNPELVHFSYERYLANALRDTFGFAGVPVKMFFRGRGKKDDEEGNV
ncbi:MAG: GTP-binding protein [Bradymonadia bacterium]|jgi:GTP-binding protein